MSTKRVFKSLNYVTEPAKRLNCKVCTAYKVQPKIDLRIKRSINQFSEVHLS